MRKVMTAFALAAFGFGCGGPDKPAARPTAPVADDDEPEQDPEDVMIPPEKFDLIEQALQRRAPAVSRCFADAIEAGAVDKDASGTIVVSLVIEPDGSSEQVKVLPASSIEADEVTDCVVTDIDRIEFTTLPKALPYTYTYAVEREY